MPEAKAFLQPPKAFVFGHLILPRCQYSDINIKKHFYNFTTLQVHCFSLSIPKVCMPVTTYNT